jgi:hypothetical protein
MEHPHRVHAWAILSGQESAPSASAHASGFFGKLMLGYQLLDTIASTLGVQSHPSLMSHIPRRSLLQSEIPSRLRQTLEYLNNWHTLVESAMQASVSRQPSHVVPSAMSTGYASFAIALRNLVHTVHQQKASNWHQILTNVYVAAFVLHWHSPVCGSHLCILIKQD